MISLDKTTENTVYRVIDIALPEGIKTHLTRLGLINGTIILKQLTAPCGDPSAYLIRGAKIAVRNEHARLISVERAEL